jgi:hypothetical protein
MPFLANISLPQVPAAITSIGPSTQLLLGLTLYYYRCLPTTSKNDPATLSVLMDLFVATTDTVCVSMNILSQATHGFVAPSVDDVSRGFSRFYH